MARNAAATSSSAPTDLAGLWLEALKKKMAPCDKTAELAGGALDLAKILGNLDELDEAKRRKKCEELCELSKAALDVRRDFESQESALGAARADVEQALKDAEDDDFEMPDFAASFFKYTADAKRQKPDVTQESDYNKLRKRCKIDAVDDDEIEIEDTLQGGAATLKDPITQALFKDPVKSKKCGHVYSKATVTSYFGRGSKACAFFGCNATLTKDDFERDVETELDLKRFERSQQQQQSQASQQRRTQAVDLDDSDDDDDD
mmetsp:Transcript_22495/g.69227  ORF Transcript_22495/g.69227 Transcript_22495/m.69227 type:complete len:262 (+) Transcript_22495:116-901(+)|eukprot:CAMPEP_0198657738 /NCGR_PEP_ID=MMETSP1467-20131203/19034_1 /TAXON_ID=1462469 /ORGANISM="unid. sp., Strain CCMP2135" /LENGTH=261 /DNA_ID=CAMNT_0044393957 /DNA_START=30 /DNA_END=815 /DNA_ORIENTATION=+